MANRIIWTPECKRCKKRLPMNPHDRIPAMVGFVLDDGTKLNICRNCLEDLGKYKEQGRTDDFFREMENNNE